MKETLSSISQRLGISTATISRVLSGNAKKYRISEKTAAIVTAEASRCHYIPSLAAQSLRTNKTKTIGLLMPKLSNPYFADISSAIISEANSKGYTAIIADTMENVEVQKDCISALLSRKVDGIIAAPCGNDSKIFKEINARIAPVVLIDRYFEDATISYVTSNNYKGAFDATSLLINNGHKNIVCIQGDEASLPNKKRVGGYLDALSTAGLQDNARILGNAFSIQNGYLETKLLLSSSSNRPSAIFALSYTILLGVIKAIKEASLVIPDDISIISFDDNISLDYMTPSISRVGQPTEEMGQLAAKMLFNKLNDNDTNELVSHIELSTELLIRKSVIKNNGADEDKDKDKNEDK
ncbi:MAG: LacI family transcriptional regulator [Bacteroidales bacterium]|jgi:LacI family transcriptional regulator|nr:LacI family transcriptional regulator [Bacteroidales bacterium]MCI1785661.1 LacI family transcriptional regulator [Bacteroidales bacterium]